MSEPPPGDASGLDALVGRADGVQRAFEGVPTAMASVKLPDYRFTACNAAYRAMYGGRTDLLGKSPLEAWPELQGQELVELLDRVRDDGEPAAYHGWRFQLDIASSGRLVDTYVDFTATPYRDHEGAVAGIHFTLTDVTARVTERLRAEEQSRSARLELADALDVVTALQDALLPDSLPVLPQVDAAAAYLLADHDRRAGGDWFDCVLRPNGTIALLVGDVVGSGVTASAVMGQMRAVLHDRLLGDEPVAEALAALDRYAAQREESHAATVCLVVLDPTSGSIEYCTAGHPPPLVVTEDGEARFLAPTGAAPLATGGGLGIGEDTLGQGDLVLLYTDGLLERPGRSIMEATVELSHVTRQVALGRAVRVGASARRVALVTEQGLELLTRSTGYADDITMLAAQRVSAPEPFSVQAPAEPREVGAVRRKLHQWLAPLDIGAADDIAVQHAVGELVTNAVEHAYRDESPDAASVAVRAELDSAGVLTCTVTDTGHWREREPDHRRGRGLAMVQGLVDSLELRRQESGTTAVFRHRLSRPAHLMTGRHVTSGPAVAGAQDVPFSADASGDRVTVCGPVDVSSAERLRMVLQRVGSGGLSGITVDLAGVTHLGSAGVQVLHELHGDGTSMTLSAPYGSVAQHVLELVRLPYDPQPSAPSGPNDLSP